jgi:hypothetical protein
MDFELFQRICVKLELTKICSPRLLPTIIANPPELNFGWEVLHGDLKAFQYDMVGMHNLTPKIQQLMEFQI